MKRRYGLSLDTDLLKEVDAARGRYPRTALIEDLLRAWVADNDLLTNAGHRHAGHVAHLSPPRDRKATSRTTRDTAEGKPLPKIAPRRT